MTESNLLHELCTKQLKALNEQPPDKKDLLEKLEIQMNNIKHHPITKIKQVEKLYSEKDGVEVKYVCTTEFKDSVADIFYRDSPHPEYGNKYFAIFFRGENTMIANADCVEDLTFGMVYNDENQLEYSQSRHDYKNFKNGNMIDGGRAYIRSSGNFETFSLKNGQWITK